MYKLILMIAVIAAIAAPAASATPIEINLGPDYPAAQCTADCNSILRWLRAGPGPQNQEGQDAYEMIQVFGGDHGYLVSNRLQVVTARWQLLSTAGRLQPPLPVPEPASVLLMLAGLMLMLATRPSLRPGQHLTSSAIR